MRLDVHAREPHFVDHLAAVWAALPLKTRGTFRVESRELLERAASHGIQAIVGFDKVDRPTLVASIGDLRQARVAGRTRLAMMEHGAGQSYGGDRLSADHPSYAGGAKREAVGLFLHPNDHAAARDRAAYPKARVEVVGCAKLDELPAREPGPGPMIAFGFHWDDSRTVAEVRSGFVDFREGILRVAQHHQVIGHGHPRIIDRLATWYERHGIEVVRDFREVCRRADVYACDNSSSLFEFASTGRPVVVLNPRIYRRTVNHGLRFWDAADVGVQCDDAAMLPAAVDLAVEDPADVATARDRALELVYKYRSGAAKRAAAALGRWLASLPKADAETATGTSPRSDTSRPSEKVVTTSAAAAA